MRIVATKVEYGTITKKVFKTVELVENWIAKELEREEWVNTSTTTIGDRRIAKTYDRLYTLTSAMQITYTVPEKR